MKQTFAPLTKEEYNSIEPGDKITRMLGFSVPMELLVRSVNDTTIDAGWVFDRNTGLEIDEDIPVIVSYISKIVKKKDL